MARLLVIAYACEPGRGSEWGISWAFVSEWAKTQEIWVIAHEDNRAGMEAFLAKNPPANPINVTYVKLPAWLAWMRNSNYALLNVHYYLWQWLAGSRAKKLHDRVRFDVVQHISFSRWWMASAGAALVSRGVKFVFGPCVGGEQMPRTFSRRAPLWMRWSELQRSIARFIWTHDPMMARSIRRASMVVGGTPASIKGMLRYGPRRVEMLSAILITDTRLIESAKPVRAARVRGTTMRMCSVGGLVYYRGVDLILRAIARSGIQDFHFTHCCGGDMLSTCKALASELGIADRVTFTGETKHAENLQHVAKSDLLIHLVLRDSQGVVPEALALGVPVLALDHHSMSAIVDEHVGHKVPMADDITPEQIVERVAEKLRYWASHREELAAMSPACVERSQELSPEHRVATFRRFHAELLQSDVSVERTQKPATVSQSAR
jgi:glycosyltransferase involved in cell wall biosynthesis